MRCPHHPGRPTWPSSVAEGDVAGGCARHGMVDADEIANVVLRSVGAEVVRTQDPAALPHLGKTRPATDSHAT
jgi:hypothetical protein